MGALRSFRELEVWRRSFALCRRIYELTSRFPPDERFGLAAQLRRAAVSVPSNIAEGYSRGRRMDYVRFLRMARGALAEMETQLLLSDELSLLKSDSSDGVLDEVVALQRMLAAMIRSLSAREANKE